VETKKKEEPNQSTHKAKKYVDWEKATGNVNANSIPSNPNSPTNHTSSHYSYSSMYEAPKPTNDDEHRWRSQNLQYTQQKEQYDNHRMIYELGVAGINETVGHMKSNPQALQMTMVIGFAVGGLLCGTHISKGSEHSGKICLASAVGGGALGFYLTPIIHNFFYTFGRISVNSEKF
jgi:hypothetical protein